MFFRKTNEPVYKIVFCDKNDLFTQFGEDNEIFHTYESAKNRIESTVAGWGYAIEYKENDGWKIDSAWLKIKKIG